MSVLSSSDLENTFGCFIFLKMYSSVRISLCIRHMIYLIMNYERYQIMNLKFLTVFPTVAGGPQGPGVQ